ncbi:hypothetical protein ACFY4C_21100 [Actinomadura viridis]|uniref:hypothetical protein n=1 Tax=Actinomadura viridis TaxID=58110 RepID=UPI0036748731
MSLITREPTHAERRLRQRRSHELLGEFLALGEEKDLPVLDWRVTEFALVGGARGVDRTQRRVAFESWTAALDLGRWEDRESPTGHVHLHAYTENWQGRRVSVAVMAGIAPEDPA